MSRLRPLDFVLFISLFSISIFLIKKGFSQKGNIILVNANNRHYEYSLEKEGIYEVEGLLGKTVFEIKNKKVRIIDSPCPGKNCIKQGHSNPLVCLPNKVIITLENYGEFDALSE